MNPLNEPEILFDLSHARILKALTGILADVIMKSRDVSLITEALRSPDEFLPDE